MVRLLMLAGAKHDAGVTQVLPRRDITIEEFATRFGASADVAAMVAAPLPTSESGQGSETAGRPSP